MRLDSGAGYRVERVDDFMVVLASVPSGSPRAYVKNAEPLLRISSAANVHNGELELKTLQGAAPLLPKSC